ncbi:MAG: site-specific integrase [Pirellulales bacterium]
MTLTEYARSYVADRDQPLAPSTVEKLFSMVWAFERWYGRPIGLDMLTVDLIDRWIADALDKGRKPPTVEWYRSMMLTLWRTAYREGRTTAVAPPVTRPRKAKAKQPEPAEAKPAREPIIQPAIRAKLVKAAQMAADGKSREHIAAVLGVQPHNIRDWQVRHPVLWEMATTTAMKTVVEMVRRMAGTRAVITDPVGFAEAAYVAERWCRKHGEPLYVDNPEAMTLTRFYDEFYFRRRHSGGRATADTVKLYRTCLRQWALLTGDPPLQEITDELLAAFHDALATLPGRLGRRISPNTVRARLVHILTVLRFAGPPGHRNYGAAGLIERVPYLRLPQGEINEPLTVPEVHLSATYRAASQAKIPTCHGIDPGHWWRALFVTAFNTGLRIGTLLKLEWKHVRWAENQIKLPANVVKTRRGLTLPIEPVVVTHLRRIEGPWEHVFPWPYTREYMRTYLHGLQDLAGIPKGEHFGMHRVRKTTATELYAISPKAAMVALGHSKLDMTLTHYVGGREIVSKAIGQLPQPTAFTE